MVAAERIRKSIEAAEIDTIGHITGSLGVATYPDHSENLDELFKEYFKCGGNGSVKHLFDMEFSKFKIDNE